MQYSSELDGIAPENETKTAKILHTNERLSPGTAGQWKLTRPEGDNRAHNQHADAQVPICLFQEAPILNFHIL